MRVIGSWLVIIAGMLLSIWMGFSGKSFGDELSISKEIAKLPTYTEAGGLAFNQAVLYDLSESKFKYGVTLTVKEWTVKKIPVHLDLGFAPTDELIGAVGVRLVNVGDYLDWPVIRHLIIEPMGYASVRRLGFDFKDRNRTRDEGNNEASFGVGVKLASLRW